MFQINYEIYCRIQAMKAEGKFQWQVVEEIGCSMSTINQYWNMSGEKFVSRPSPGVKSVIKGYRKQIVSYLEDNATISNLQIYNKLAEENVAFTLSKRTVYEHLYEIRAEECFPYASKKRGRRKRPDYIVGEETQVDMGQIVINGLYGHKVRIYIFAMVLSYSRMLFVTFRTEPLTSADFVEAHKQGFVYFGGRTKTIMYDQDRVMIVSENAGNIIFTEKFEEFKTQVGFSIYLCHKYDPSTN